MTTFDPPSGPSGPKACEAIANTMIGHFTTRLEVEAARRGGALSAAAIRELAESFLAEEAKRFQSVFRRSYDACSVTREAKQWESARRKPFDRILMKAFAPLFPPRQGDDGGKGVLSRRVIPGFNLAIDKMIGPMLYEQCQRKSQAILDRHRASSGGYDWERIHADPETHALTTDVLVVVAHYFSAFEHRRDWFLSLVNSHLAPAQPGSPDSTWQLTETSFAEMMRALFADVRAQVVARPAELRRRYGEHTVDTVAAFFRRLDQL
ncbi:conserved hypothetical protein [Magnetospirillum sp. LM-5]|uniref:hypothetical protein n=1 Tax=Magnetospirillum sp. LM-5 TaxID=2681466 RepID=UPI0013834E10|nr:hypothetical protein [Magnetospirillum sp. LM-5]CAA7621283.1 conserved hypothetical protein [Magnetospirillum sp. LM-5]